MGRFLPDLPAANCTSGTVTIAFRWRYDHHQGINFFDLHIDVDRLMKLTYIYLSSTQQAYMEERAEVLREDVRKILIGSTELPETLNLILTLQRLGLDYYYEDDIDKLLHRIYNSDYSDKDLNLVSLRFYLLRKNGYDVSPGKIRSCTRNCVFFF
jgi:hypothetical protein